MLNILTEGLFFNLWQKKEANTDLWVYDLLKEAKISENFTAQGSDIQEILKIKETSEFY